MITKSQFDRMPAGAVIQAGIVENSPEGIYMTSDRYEDYLAYVVVKGHAQDWTLYVGWMEMGFEYIRYHGDKVSMESMRKVFDADDEVYECYRR